MAESTMASEPTVIQNSFKICTLHYLIYNEFLLAY